MTPKSLLGLPECVSPESDFLPETGFQELLPDPDSPSPDKVERLVFCSGKVYYDLIKYRKEAGIKNSAIIRVEQFFPFNEELAKTLVAPYAKATRWVWCQEEPENMGAWRFIAPYLEKLGVRPAYAGRDDRSSPAVGAKATHYREQKQLVKDAFLV